MKSILFVCLGNICRSPLADGVASSYVVRNDLDIKVDSCGTSSFHVGETPCDNSQKVAELHNIDISTLQSRQVTKDDFINYDFIIALDDSNYDDLLELGCPKNKLSKLGFYGYDNNDVLDPYFFNGFEGFEKVYTMIEDCTIQLINDIKK